MHSPNTNASTSGPNASNEEEEEDEEQMNLSQLQSFASRVQYATGDSNAAGPSTRPKIVIPKRGEKDFEPLRETVNLQEMMLQKSREALFGALQGVRGGNIQAISHAFLLRSARYPKIVVTRGHLLDTMGISMQQDGHPTYLELLPEEALYLLERGTLQIWISADPSILDVPKWSESMCGIEGCSEMSVMEAFDTFLGQDYLTWERYQAYAYLKRLGYIVQRTRRFLPPYFLSSHTLKGKQSPRSVAQSSPQLPPFRTWWFSIPYWLIRGISGAMRLAGRTINLIRNHRVDTYTRGSSSPGLSGLSGAMSYASLGLGLHWSQSGFPPDRPALDDSPVADKLQRNPYLPFFHVWKPDTPWAKSRWEKGSAVGLGQQPPAFAVAVVDARNTPLPTIDQLSEIFEDLPEEKRPARRTVPQAHSTGTETTPSTAALLDGRHTHATYTATNVPGVRAGDRALVVAVNDSGNTGWVRFGRTGFGSVFDL